MKISIIVTTARPDYPYIGRLDLHIFKPTIDSLKNQTMKDFELVIVDFLYNERKDYFKNLDLPFKIKHIPSSPNIWHNERMNGICTQLNKGIIYSDGELLFFSGEGFLYIPEFCERLWKRHKEGYIPLVWYFSDNTFTPEVFNATEDQISKYPAESKLPYNIKYNINGYVGKNITMDHRPSIAFKKGDIFNSPWEWWFGCSGSPLSAMLKINGFDQRFDGDKSLFDCDIGSRLELSGYKKFGIFKDLFIIRIMNNNATVFTAKSDSITSVKCNFPLMHWSRQFKHFVANDHENIDEDIKWCKEVYCAKLCPVRDDCRENNKVQYPFEHKEGYGANCGKKGFEFWRTHQVKINLADERNKRIAGDDKYKEGTFT